MNEQNYTKLVKPNKKILFKLHLNFYHQIYFLLLLGLLPISNAWSHPHSFINSKVEFITQPFNQYKAPKEAYAYGPLLSNLQTFSANSTPSIYGIRLQWELDPITSAPLLQELRSNNPSVIGNLRDEIINNIRSAEYFSQLYYQDNIDEQLPANHNLENKVEFTQSVIVEGINIDSKNQVSIKFVIPLSKSIPLNKVIRYDSYEKTYFTAITVDNSNNVIVDGHSCRINIINPIVSSQLIDYVSSKDIENTLDDTVGAKFAQEIRVQCM